MSAVPHPRDPRHRRVQDVLDSLLDARARLNRRIRRVRDLSKALEAGDPVPELEVVLQAYAPDAEADVAPAPDAARGRAAPGRPALRPLPAPLEAPASHLEPRGGSPTSSSAPGTSVDVGALRDLDADDLDALPYGVITLDREGRVVGYNDTESRMVGLGPEEVLGRDFFREVAPCTRVGAFEGRFRDYVEQRGAVGVEEFEFVFRFREGAQRVVILFTPARRRGHVHVCVFRR